MPSAPEMDIRQQAAAAMMPHMRTTVTLDPDVAAKLKEETRREDISSRRHSTRACAAGSSVGDAQPQPYHMPRPQRWAPGLASTSIRRCSWPANSKTPRSCASWSRQVKLPDVNLLVYAVDDSSRHYGRIRPWLEQSLGHRGGGLRLDGPARLPSDLNQPGRLRQPPSRLTGLRVRRRVARFSLSPPSFTQRAARRPPARPPARRIGTAGNLTSDAHLAALAIEHGAEVCSSDNDFARFAGLRWFNPLAR